MRTAKIINKGDRLSDTELRNYLDNSSININEKELVEQMKDRRWRKN